MTNAYLSLFFVLPSYVRDRAHLRNSAYDKIANFGVVPVVRHNVKEMSSGCSIEGVGY